jgi:hypothetical protein
VFLRDGTFTGTVHLEFATQRFGAVDSVTPGSLTLQPGQTGRLRVHVNLPQSPGDSDHDLVISNSSADRTVVPVILRSLVPVDGHGASFTGTLTGGNGRPGPAEEQTFAFDVPRGRPSLSTAFTFDDDVGTEVLGFLVDPRRERAELPEHRLRPTDGARPHPWPTGGHARPAARPLEVRHGRAQPGGWEHAVSRVPRTGLLRPAGDQREGRAQRRQAGGGQAGDGAAHRPQRRAGDRGRVRRPAPERSEPAARAAHLAGHEPAAADPGRRPGADVHRPTQTDTVLGGAEASAPILLEMGFGVFGEGDPDLLGQSAGNRAAAAYSAREVANGPWFLAPALRGPFDAPATGTANLGMLAHTRSFDHATASSTGDVWQQTVDDGQEPSDYSPLTLQPGQAGKITVTFTPQGKRGDRVRGVLYVDDFSFRTLTGNEQLAIPYSYRIR